MKAKAILTLFSVPLLTLCLTACGGTDAASAPAEARLDIPVPAGYDQNAEFIDAPETAPVIIDGDEEISPSAEPVSEIYQAAPEAMPETT